MGRGRKSRCCMRPHGMTRHGRAGGWRLVACGFRSTDSADGGRGSLHPRCRPPAAERIPPFPAQTSWNAGSRAPAQGGTCGARTGARAAQRGGREPPREGCTSHLSWALEGWAGQRRSQTHPPRFRQGRGGGSARTVAVARSLASINWIQKRKAEEQMAVIDSAEDSRSSGREDWLVWSTYVDGSCGCGRMVFSSSSGKQLSRRLPPAVLSQPLSARTGHTVLTSR